VLEEEPQLNSPGEDNFDPTMFAGVAKKLGLDKDMKAYQGQGGFTRSKSPCPLARALFVAGCGPQEARLPWYLGRRYRLVHPAACFLPSVLRPRRWRC